MLQKVWGDDDSDRRLKRPNSAVFNEIPCVGTTPPFLSIVKLLAILILRETLQQPPAMSQMGDRHTRPKVNLDDVTFLIGQT